MAVVLILVTALFLGLSCRWLGRPWRPCLLLSLVGTGLLIAGFAELASAFTAAPRASPPARAPASGDRAPSAP